MAEAAADRDREVQGVPQEQEAATRPVCRGARGVGACDDFRF